MDDFTKGRYGMSLCRYILAPLRNKYIYLQTFHQNKHFKGPIAPMMDLDVQNIKYLNTGEILPEIFL